MRISVAGFALWAVLCFAPPAAGAPSTLTIAQAKVSPAGTIARVSGFVVGSYLCAHCPRGAMCKPCMSESKIQVAGGPSPSGAELAVAVLDPASFAPKVPYRFEIVVEGSGGIDARLLRSRREDSAVWIDAPKPEKKEPLP